MQAAEWVTLSFNKRNSLNGLRQLLLMTKEAKKKKGHEVLQQQYRPFLCFPSHSDYTIVPLCSSLWVDSAPTPCAVFYRSWRWVELLSPDPATALSSRVSLMEWLTWHAAETIPESLPESFLLLQPALKSETQSEFCALIWLWKSLASNKQITALWV